MLSERGVSSIFLNRKRKFSTIDGGGFQESGSSSDPGPSVWSIFCNHVASNWAESVVSLTSVDEAGSMHPACTGVVFHHTKTRAYLLASASLFRSSHEDRHTMFTIKAKVRLPNGKVVQGIPIFHGSNLSVVSVLPKGGHPRAACIDHHQLQLEPQRQLFYVRRFFDSGKLMATPGMLAGDPTGASLEEAGAEGLLVDILGNMVGLNCYAKDGTTFMPRSIILDFVAEFQKARAKLRARDDLWHKINSQCEEKTIKLKARFPSHISGLEVGKSTPTP